MCDAVNAVITDLIDNECSLKSIAGSACSSADYARFVSEENFMTPVQS